MVYLDTNDNSQLDWVDGNGNEIWDRGEGERWTLTDQDGVYFFADLLPGDYIVRQQTPDRHTLLLPGSSGYLDVVRSLNGGLGDNASGSAKISADGRFVVFLSDASDLVANDTNNSRDIFVFDRQLGTVERVSVSSTDEQGNGASDKPSISDDGRYITFCSTATNLVDGDTNGYQDIFVHDMQTGQTKRVSVLPDGTQSDRHSYLSAISADGHFIVFENTGSNFSDMDYYGSTKLYVYDQQTGDVQFLNVAQDNTQMQHGYTAPSISADGRYVAFWSTASNLVDNDTNGMIDVFVFDRQTETTQRVSFSSNDQQANNHSYDPAISPDGRYVTYYSSADNLVEGDTNVTTDIFIRDLLTGQTSRISVSAEGIQANASSYSATFSPDGRYIAYRSSASNLVAGDTNGKFDIFVYDTQTGSVERVSNANDGSLPNDNTYAPDLSLDAEYVVFNTLASNLVVGDTNGVSDVFIYKHDTGVHHLSLSVGEDITDANFQYLEQGSIGDRVWHDFNTNGVQDENEPGLEGIIVNLLDDQQQIIATTLTDANGLYLFDYLAMGAYYVDFEQPTGFQFSTQDAGANDSLDSDADTTTGISHRVELTSVTPLEHVDAGLNGPGTINGIAWQDLDADGYQDDNEPVMAGITVYLLFIDEGINVITGTTDSQGYYEYTNLDHNQYTLSFMSPQGYLFTEMDAIGDDLSDSDVDPLTGATNQITIDFDQVTSTIDVGLMPVASIGDRVWDDLNANGIQDDGEPGLANITVNLLNGSGNVLQTTQTDSDGLFAFTDILAGGYRVAVVLPSDFQFTSYQQGGDSLIDSDLNSSTGYSDLYTLGAGESADIDAGLVFTSAIYHTGVIDLADIPLGYLDGALFEGFEAGAMTGSDVSNAGDVNGDGFDDFLIATNRANQYRGATHLIYGTASGLQAAVKLNGALDGTVDGAVFYGDNPDDFSGQCVSSVGDLNGDGFADLIISTSYRGKTYLIYGRQSGLTGAIDLGDVAAGNIAGAVFTGLNGERAGWSISDAGDVNGDGLDDMLISTDESGNSSQSGNTYLVYGQTQEYTGTINLAGIQSGQLDGAVFNFDWQVNSYGTGSSVSSAGDVNGDGLDDLIIGMTYASPHSNREGQVFLIYGHQTGLTGKINLSDVISGQVQGAVFNGIDEIDFTGEHVSDAGDVNADGYDDLLIYSRYGDAHGFLTGEVFLIYGQATALTGEFELADVTRGLIDGALFTGTDGYDWAGSSIDGAGDVNGDGIDDFIIGAYGDESKGTYTGALYLIYGKTTDFSGTIDLNNVQSGQVDGAVFLGIEKGDEVGRSSSFAGDVNGDGLTDLVIGATWANSLGSFTGQALLVYGQGTGISDRVWDDSNANGVQDQGESGVAGVTVRLFDGSDYVIATTVTNDDGDYAFGNLTTGDYRVGFELLDGYTFTTQNVGTNDAVDSDVNAQTGLSDIISLTNGQYINNLDAGMVFTTVIDAGEPYQSYEGYPVQLNASGTQTHSHNIQYAWDLDNDGLYDDATGVSPTLSWSQVLALGLPSDSSSVTIGLQVTDDLGTYVDQTTLQILNVAPSVHSGTLYHVDYGGTVTLNANVTDAGDDNLRIEWDLDGDGITGETGANATRGDEVGLTPTFISRGLAADSFAQVTLHAWDDVTQASTWAHIIISPASSIGDRVWHDLNANNVQDENEPGISDVIVNLLDNSYSHLAYTTTDIDGNYLFDNLVSGNYYIEVVAPVDFGFTPTDVFNYSIEFGNDIITLDSSTTTANNPSVVRGNAIIANDGMILKSTTAVIALGVDDQNTTTDVGLYHAASISGTTWHDLNGDALKQDTESVMSGITVFIDDNGNQQIDWIDANSNNRWDTGEGEMWAVSADDGSYSFINLVPGTYVLNQVSPAGYEQVGAINPAYNGLDVSYVAQAANGDIADIGAYNSQISGNGRYVVYESISTNLVEGGLYQLPEIYVCDLYTNQTKRVTVGLGGQTANSYSSSPSISDDGRYIAFASYASNLSDDDQNGIGGVFVYDQITGQMTLVSRSFDGQQGNDWSHSPKISGDGRFVTYVSSATNLVADDLGNRSDIFVYDMQTGTTQMVSVSSQGEQGNFGSSALDISDDGRYVIFSSFANNLVEDDDNTNDDVFVHDRLTGQTHRLSQNNTNTPSNGWSLDPVISGDGNYAIFISDRTNLVANDNNNMSDVFIYDLQTNQIKMLTDNGVQGNSYPNGQMAISDNGRFIVFSSWSNNFFDWDVNLDEDIFVFDQFLNQLQVVSFNNQREHLVGQFIELSISDDGRFITYTGNMEGVVPGDDNHVSDVFLIDRYSTDQNVTVSSGQNVVDINLGNFSPVISDYVWFDANGNGVQDEGEAGISGVAVNLLDVQGALLATTITDSNGLYMFAGLFADDYVVEFELPQDYVFTHVNQGSDATADSDADPVTGRSGVITLGSSDVLAGVDAGMMPAFTIAQKRLFYNNSVYDGNGTTVDAADEQAVDMSRQAMSDGQVGNSQNYTSSRNGITGIIIDGTDLHLPDISADDFIFKVGNDSLAENWVDAPMPSDIVLLRGQGIDGADRIAITWDAGSIVEQWLQVTIRFDGNINVATDEVFYFGSCVGDVTGDGFVNINDVFSIWNHRVEQGTNDRVPVGNVYDLNGDGWVNITDVFLAWNYRKERGVHPGLRMIQPTAINTGAPDQLAMAIASMNGRYALNVVNDNESHISTLTGVSLTEYLPDWE